MNPQDSELWPPCYAGVYLASRLYGAGLLWGLAGRFEVWTWQKVMYDWGTRMGLGEIFREEVPVRHYPSAVAYLNHAEHTDLACSLTLMPFVEPATLNGRVSMHAFMRF